MSELGECTMSEHRRKQCGPDEALTKMLREKVIMPGMRAPEFRPAYLNGLWAWRGLNEEGAPTMGWWMNWRDSEWGNAVVCEDRDDEGNIIMLARDVMMVALRADGYFPSEATDVRVIVTLFAKSSPTFEGPEINWRDVMLRLMRSLLQQSNQASEQNDPRMRAGNLTRAFVALCEEVPGL